MTWFKVDDSFHSHAKTLKAGNAALGLWVRCGSHCAQHLTDGFVPREIALLYGTTALAARLVEAGLWRPVDGGWAMHDYHDYNPSAEKVQAERHAATQRQRSAREAAKSRRVSRRDNRVSHGPPDPTRPDPTPKPPPGAAGDESPDRARDNLPPQFPSIPDPPQGPAVTGPTAADAYRLVNAAIGREHPHAVRTALAIETGALLVVDTDRELIFAALTLWLDKPHLGPKSLPHLVSEVIRIRNRPTPGMKPSTTDQRVAAMQALKVQPAGGAGPNLRALPGGGR